MRVAFAPYDDGWYDSGDDFARHLPRVLWSYPVQPPRDPHGGRGRNAGPFAGRTIRRRSLGGRRRCSLARLRQGEAVHLSLHVGRAESARYVRSQAASARYNSRSVPADLDHRAGPANLRAFWTARQSDGQGRPDPVAVARRSGAPLERPHNGHRAPAADQQERCHAAQPQRHAAPGLAAGQTACSGDGNAALCPHAVDCLSSGRAGRASARPAWRLARAGVRPGAGGRRSERSELEAAGARAAARDHSRAAAQSPSAAGSNRQQAGRARPGRRRGCDDGPPGAGRRGALFARSAAGF